MHCAPWWPMPPAPARPSPDGRATLTTDQAAPARLRFPAPVVRRLTAAHADPELLAFLADVSASRFLLLLVAVGRHPVAGEQARPAIHLLDEARAVAPRGCVDLFATP